MLDFYKVTIGLLLPLLGTSLGAAMVFFMKKEINITFQKLLLGFASGVMLAASVWSLLIPAIDIAENTGSPGWLAAAIGFMMGIGFLLLLDTLMPHMHLNSEESEGKGKERGFAKSSMLVLAVVLHNIPEGMAVGVVFAGMLNGDLNLSFSAALALSIGIALQNFPEGAVISMPLLSSGISKKRAFFYGFLSGVVEPLGAILMIFLATKILPFMPYCLSFAAGAMIYVVVEELIPGAAEGKHSNAGVIGTSLGFVLMMVLDIALG